MNKVALRKVGRGWVRMENKSKSLSKIAHIELKKKKKDGRRRRMKKKEEGKEEEGNKQKRRTIKSKHKFKNA